MSNLEKKEIDVKKYHLIQIERCTFKKYFKRYISQKRQVKFIISLLNDIN